MKRTMHILIWATIAALVTAQSPLKILYVGEKGEDARTAVYRAFLGERFAKVVTTTHEDMSPALAAAADVVLLEWHQGEKNPFPPKSSPLGARADWTKPTVLIGSAGLFTACIWKVNGGSG